VTELDQLETPALVVDLDRMERNLDRVASYARTHGLALRPHIKTHKSPLLATEQMERGAIGLTCATPSRRR
jgi:D-serine deaminase-like pyridoxal phosphate-dependent protein